NLYEFIATQFNAEQQVEAFGILVKDDVGKLVSRLLENDTIVPYIEQMLEHAIVLNKIDTRTLDKFSSILDEKITTGFVSKYIFEKRSITWLSLMKPDKLKSTVKSLGNQET